MAQRLPFARSATAEESPPLGGPERRLIDHGVEPFWSPDGREVRFQRERFVNFNSAVFAAPVDGRPTHQVLAQFTNDGVWGWIAPRADGRVTFFGEHRKLGSGMFTVSEDGGVVRSTWDGPPFEGEGVIFVRAIWNHSGTALCVETGNGLVQSLWLVRVEADTLRMLSAERLTTSSTSELASTFSADGTRVLFSSQHVSERLWLYPLDHRHGRLGTGRPLTAEDAIVGGASVSPDGRSFLQAMRRPGERATNTWLTDVATGQTRLFAEGTLCNAWTQDGQEVACVRMQIDPLNVSGGPTSLELRSIDGRQRTVSPWTADPLLWPSSWSIDHRELLVTRQSKDYDVVAWPIADPPATAPSHVVFAVPSSSVWATALSPNRRWLTFNAVTSSVESPTRSFVGVTSAEGLPQRPWQKIAAYLDWTDKPQWSADGRTVYFVASRPAAYFNLMGVHIDPERGTTIGEPFQITEFNSPTLRMSPFAQRTTMAIRGSNAFLTMVSATGNIWMLDNVDR